MHACIHTYILALIRAYMHTSMHKYVQLPVYKYMRVQASAPLSFNTCIDASYLLSCCSCVRVGKHKTEQLRAIPRIHCTHFLHNDLY